jgi:hypothetical protein
VNLLHPASAGAVVNLWFVDGVPVRLIHGTTRYRVVAAERWPDDDGWTITARSATGQSGRFAVRSLGSGWLLSSAS